VQESLTNVIKHSAATTATVTVATTGTTIDIEVADPGPPRPASSTAGSGHGLVGLDERVRLVGGRAEYGAQGDGFRVHAALPTGAGR
jgi:signal transduction histidine kinase